MVTEEEIARAIHDALHMVPACDYPQCMCDYECEREALSLATYAGAARAVLALVQPALAKAVEAEREACAYDAEHVLHGVSLAGVNKDYAEGALESIHACAAAIRSRAQESETGPTPSPDPEQPETSG